MNITELHPEELLDKKVEGTLTPSEAARLEAHLEQCKTCRFEMQARTAFADEIDAGEIAERAVRGASLALGMPETKLAEMKLPQPALPPISTRMRVARRRGATMLLAAAALLVAGAGWGAWSEGGPRALIASIAARVSEVTGAASPEATKGRARSAGPKPTSAVTPIDAPEASAIVEPTLDPTLAIPAPMMPVVEAPQEATPPPPQTVRAPIAEPRATTHTTAMHRATHPHAAERIAPAVNAAPPAPAAQATSAASLFDAANGARNHGERETAIALYRDLQSQFPASREARVSRITLGRFLLDGGDSASALAMFDAALADRNGDLDEEALVGRALALRRLGRSADEASAWSSLLASYPSSPHAARARARLAALGR